MKLLALAVIAGAGAAYSVYEIWQQDWTASPWLWGAAVVGALVCLGALLKDEDNRVTRARADQHQTAHGKMQEVGRQQPHGEHDDEGTI